MFQPFLTSGSGPPQHPYMVPQADVSQQPLYPMPQLYQPQHGLQYTAMHYPSGGVPVQVGSTQLPGRALLGASHMPPSMSHGYSMHQSSITSPQKTYPYTWSEERGQAQGQTQGTSAALAPTHSATPHLSTTPLPLPPPHSLHIKPWNIPSNASSRLVQPTPLSSLANSQQVKYLTGPSSKYSSTQYSWTASTEKKNMDTTIAAGNPLSALDLASATFPTPVIAPTPPLKPSYQSQNVSFNMKSSYGRTDINTAVTSDTVAKIECTAGLLEESCSSTVDDDGPPIAPHPFATLKKNALQVEVTDAGICSKTDSQSVDTSLIGPQDQLGSKMASVSKQFTERVKADRFMEIALKRGIVVSSADAEPSVTPGALDSQTGGRTPSPSGDDSDVNSIVSGKEETDTHTDSSSIDNTDAKSLTSEGCSRKFDGGLSDLSNDFAKVIIEDACSEINLELNVDAVPFNPAPSSKLDANAIEFQSRFTAEEASSLPSSLNPASPEFKPSFFRDKAKNIPIHNDTDETEEASDELEVCRLFKKNHTAGVDVYIADAPTPVAEASKDEMPMAESLKDKMPMSQASEAPCQSDSLFVSVAVNTKRIRVNDTGVQTPLAFEPREVGVNTDEVCFDETSDFFTQQIGLKMKSQGVNACVETRCQQIQAKIGPKVKSQGTQVGSAEDLMAKRCDMCSEKDVQLIEAQMQVCHLKAQICVSEMQRQVDDLQHSKTQITSFFSPQSGVDSLTDMVDARIVWLQDEIAQTKIHLMNCLKDLQCGRPLSAIPAFGITLPTMMGNEVYTPKELKFLRCPPTDVNPESLHSKIYAREADKATGDNACPQNTMPIEQHLENIAHEQTLPGLKNKPPLFETISLDGGIEGVAKHQNLPFELGFERMSPYKSLPAHEMSEELPPHQTKPVGAGLESMSPFHTVSMEEGCNRVPTRPFVKETPLEMQNYRSQKGCESASYICESHSLKDQKCDGSEIHKSGSLKGQEFDSDSVHMSEAGLSTGAVEKCRSVASGSELLNSDSILSAADEEVASSSSETVMVATLESGSSKESLFGSVLNSVMISSLSSYEDDKLELMSSQCSSNSSVSEPASTVGVTASSSCLSETESQYFSGETSLSISQEKAADPDTEHCVETDFCVDIVTKSEPPLSKHNLTDNMNVTLKTANLETTTDIPVSLDIAQEHKPSPNNENISLPRHSSKASSLVSLPKPIPPLPLKLPPRNLTEIASSSDRIARQDSEYETASSSLPSTPVATDTEEKASGDADENKLDAVKPDKRIPPGFGSIQNEIEEDIHHECDIDSDLVKKVQTVLQNYKLASEKGRMDAKSSISGSPIKSTISPYKQNKLSPDKPRTSLSQDKPIDILPSPIDVPIQSSDEAYKVVNRDSGPGESVVSHLKACAMKRLGVTHAVANEEPSPDHFDTDLPSSSNQHQDCGLPMTETHQENVNTNHQIDTSDSSEINHPQVHPIQPHPIQPLQHQPPPSQQVSQQQAQQLIQPDQLNPNLFQAVLAQVVKAYPQLASNPVMLQTVCVQQTMVLQSYMKVPGGAPAVTAAPGIPGTDPDPILSEAANSNIAVGNTGPAETAQSGGAAWNPVGLLNMMQARRGENDVDQTAVSDIKTQNSDMFKFEATPGPVVRTSIQPVISATATDSESTPLGLRSYLLKDRHSTKAVALSNTSLTGETALPTEDINPFEQHSPSSLTKATSQRKRSTTRPRRGGRISPVTHDSRGLFPPVKATNIEMDEDWEDQCEKYPEAFTCTQDVKKPVHFRPVDPPRDSDEDRGSLTSSRSTTPDMWDQPYRSRHLSLPSDSSNPRSESGSFKGRSTAASQKQASGAASDIQTTSQGSSRSVTPTEEFSKMASSILGSGTQGFKGLGDTRKLSGTGLDEIKDLDVKYEQKPTKPDASFLGRLLRSNANINDRLIKDTKKSKEVKKSKPEASLDDEDDWQTVSMKKRKREQARLEPPPPPASMALVTATSKGPSKVSQSNFERLVEHLAGHFPFLSRAERIELITSIRSQRGGLTGMKLNDIVDVGRTIVQKKMMARLEHGSTPKQVTAVAAQKGSNIYNTPEFQKYYETTRKQLPNRLSITSPVNSGNDEDMCPICFEDFSVSKKQRLDCGHEFHVKCIREWVLGHERTCPTCRRYTLFQEEFPRLK